MEAVAMVVGAEGGAEVGQEDSAPWEEDSAMER
jgi:hypothetical protein